MLYSAEKEMLKEKVERLLWEVGMRVENEYVCTDYRCIKHYAVKGR